MHHFVHLHLFKTNVAIKLHCRMTSLLKLLSHYLPLLLQKTKGIHFSSWSEEIQNVSNVYYLANLLLRKKNTWLVIIQWITFHGCLLFTRLICSRTSQNPIFLKSINKKKKTTISRYTSRKKNPISKKGRV